MTHPQVTGTPGSPMAPAYRAVTLALVAMVTLVAFESMAISTVMPSASAALHGDSAYALAFSLFFTAQLLGTVLVGPWIDRSGALRPIFWGLAAFAGGSLLAGLAPTFPVLLAGRVIGGLGGGMATVALYVVIGAVYPPALRPKVFSWVSAAWVLPALIGPIIAGALAAALTWRSVFLVVVPAVAIILTVLASRSAQLHTALGHPVPSADPVETRSAETGSSETGSPEAGPTDTGTTAGTLGDHLRVARLGGLIAVAAGLFQWGGTHLVAGAGAPNDPSASSWQPVSVALALLGLAGLALTLPRLLTPGTLRLRRGLPSVMASRFAIAGAFNGSITFVPLMLVTVRGLSLTTAGLLIAIGSLGWSTGSYIQGRSGFIGRAHELVRAGTLCVASGCAALACCAWTGAPSILMGLSLVLAGLGMGLATSSGNVLTLDLTEGAERTAASSSLQLSDVLGSVCGISFGGAAYALLAGHAAPAPEAGAQVAVATEASPFVAAWVTMALFGLLGLLAGQRTRPVSD